jgi:succinate dehydrogenase/fumarate reductase flavoprotein subunit
MKQVVTDVAIVGFGGSGASAAIEAHRAGASVTIIEKMEEGGGSTRESGGTLRIAVDPEKAARHFRALTYGTTPLSMMQVFAHGLTEIPGWIESLGGETILRGKEPGSGIFPFHTQGSSYPSFPDAEGVGERLRVKPEGDEAGGLALWNVLSRYVESCRMPVLYSHRARKLITGASRQVVGLVASTAAGDVEIRARRAVVLTCGGFNYNEEMQKQFLGVALPALSPPGRNSGDGIRMAMDVGADLWHMHSVAASFGYKIEGHEAAFYARIDEPGFLVVDQTAKRFMNETAVESHCGFLATQEINYLQGRRLRVPSYLIFDNKTRRSAPIVTETKTSYNQRVKWSRDNSEEVAKGWIKTGRTIGDLARELGLPAAELEATVSRFNDGYARGVDEMGRDRGLMRPLDQPPFFGIALWPALLNTQGGPRRNDRSQVVDVFGDPIPRLYGAGELGSIWGSLYPGAGNVCECIVYGRIAGRNAAGESPLSE